MIKKMKTKKTELVSFGDTKQAALAFYSIGHAIDRQTKAQLAQTSAIIKALREETSEIEALADVLRATNEILIQREIRKRDKSDDLGIIYHGGAADRVRKQIEAAKVADIKRRITKGLARKS